MFRALRARSRSDAAWRLLTPLLAVALVTSALAFAPTSVEAGSSGDVAAVRQRQSSAEASMRRADNQIVKLQGLRRNHAKLLRTAKQKLAKAIKRRNAARGRADSANERLRTLRLTLARETRVHPNPKGSQRVDKPKLRKRVRKLDKRVRQLDRRLHATEKKVDRVRALKQSRLKKPTKARIAARKAERERAEDKLSNAVAQMLSLSKRRAGTFGTSSGKGFTKPLKGQVSQPYGCTGYWANPSRGSCNNFHDGVDIVAPKGSRVRAAADGYVAYVGYNPWDASPRAFIVIVGHSGGYESWYAHLKPTRKVRAGQRVDRGDVVGSVGMTGHTSGPHVHWEVKKGGLTVNPRRARR